MLDADCVDKGEYVDHGTFGEIYHGAVYPSIHATVCTVFIFVTVCVCQPLFHCTVYTVFFPVSVCQPLCSLYCSFLYQCVNPSVHCTVHSCISVSTPLFIESLYCSFLYQCVNPSVHCTVHSCISVLTLFILPYVVFSSQYTLTVLQCLYCVGY